MGTTKSAKSHPKVVRSLNTTFRLLTPTPAAIATGTDNNIWFTEMGTDKIGKISPQNGEITEYDIPTQNASPDAIAVRARQ